MQLRRLVGARSLGLSTDDEARIDIFFFLTRFWFPATKALDCKYVHKKMKTLQEAREDEFCRQAVQKLETGKVPT